MNRILVDSGPLIALFDKSDRYHDQALQFLRANKAELVTSLASITEVLHLLDFNRNCQLDFLEWVKRGAVTIAEINQEDFERLHELTKKYHDLPMDFADACLVLLGEKLNLQEIATIDRDFSIYRIKEKKKFKNVFG
ncbi:PIN domain-containing protein [bacterium]|jgi:uncharacterized protein|nr:PIN domain-containing protein [bacterium]